LIPELAPSELVQWRDDPARAAPLLLDVREPWEFEVCHIEGSLSVPLTQLQARVEEVPRDRPLVVVCHHGHRSYRAATWLRGVGFAEVLNLRGGVAAWATDVDPRMPKY
jgi:rhodanese-related sulfurtransferase